MENRIRRSKICLIVVWEDKTEGMWVWMMQYLKKSLPRNFKKWTKKCNSSGLKSQWFPCRKKQSKPRPRNITVKLQNTQTERRSVEQHGENTDHLERNYAFSDITFLISCKEVREQ